MRRFPRLAPTQTYSWTGCTVLADRKRLGHDEAMAAMPAKNLSPIPSAPIGDLDLDRVEDEEEWERRVMALASKRVLEARARFERLGIIDSAGKLVSTDLPPDMLPDSDATLETG